MTPIAKISRPRLGEICMRERLFHLLDLAEQRPVTWVVAPPGAGKTTLVASWLDVRKLPGLWYQVDQRDNDIAAFFCYMGHAARNAAPRKRIPLPLFTRESRLGIQTFTLRYFESLYSLLTPPFVMVFDDYQQIPEQSGLHEIISLGLDVLPPGLRVIFISRGHPPPYLARLRSNAVVSLLGTEDIRFTLDESRDMLRLHRPAGIPDKTLRDLHERAGGWAAGMLLLTEKTAGEIKGFQKFHNHPPSELSDYFTAEILAKTEPGIRDFLMRTAFLPYMTVRLTERLTGGDKAGKLLSSLHRNSCFTERDSGTLPVYRYHPLFREFLLARAEEEMTPEHRRTIRRRSAELLEEEGRIEDAAGLLAAAGEWEELTGLVRAHANALICRGRSMALETWLRRMPREVYDRSPWLHYWLGTCRMAYNPVESLGCFDAAFREFQRQEDAAGELLAWSGAVNSILFAWDGFASLDNWIAWLDERMTYEGPFPSTDIGARVAAGMASALTWRAPHRPDITGWLDQALTLSRESGDTNLQLTAIHCAIFYNIISGNFDALPLLAREAGEIALSPDVSPLAMLLWKGVESAIKVFLPVNPAGVIADLLGCLELADKSGVHILDFWLAVQGVCASLNAGEMEKARGFLMRMETIAASGSRQAAGHYFKFMAHCCLLTGDPSRAHNHAGKAMRLFMEMGTIPPQVTCRHIMARVLFARGEQDGALRELEIAKKLAGGLSREGLYYWRCLLTEAWFRLRRDEEEAGLAALRRAMEIGARRDYLTMIHCWQPPVMASLCAKALEHGIEEEYARRFIRRYDLFPDAPPQETENWPWPVKIYTFGGFELRLSDKVVRFAGKVQKKPLQLLKTLISLGGKEIEEARITDLLWPEVDGDRAYSSFTSALWRLRKLLRNEEAVIVRQGKVSLNPRRCWTDCSAFQMLLDRMKSSGPAIGGPGSRGDGNRQNPVRLMEKLAALHKGPFLPEDELPWVVRQRENLEKGFARLLADSGAQNP